MQLKRFSVEIIEQADGTQVLRLSGEKPDGKIVVLGERRLLEIEGNVKEWFDPPEKKADWGARLSANLLEAAQSSRRIVEEAAQSSRRIVEEAAQSSRRIVEEAPTARYLINNDYFLPDGNHYAVRNARELELEYEQSFLRARPGQPLERSGRPIPRTSRVPSTGLTIPPTADAINPRQEAFRREMYAQQNAERCESLVTTIREHFPRLDVAYRLEDTQAHITTSYFHPTGTVDYQFYVRLDRVDPEDGWGTQLYSLSAAYHQRGVNLEALHGRV